MSAIGENLSAPLGVMPVRKSLVSLGYWAHQNRDEIYYAEVRPIPVSLPVRHLPLTTDCSGIVTMFAMWAGAPDPNGNNYDGTGYTGTLLDHLPHIALNETWRGDLVVFGAPPGIHAVMLLQGGCHYADPLVVSHGHPGADDPEVMSLSNMQSGFPPPTTYLRIIDNTQPA